MQAVYGLWLARNKARDVKQIAAAHDIMTGVLHHVREWRGIHQQRARTPAEKSRRKWEVPEEGWIKINSDDAVSKSGGNGGGGVVLRDHNAAFIAGSCYHYPHISDPEATGILACKQALQMVLELNLDRVHVELDSLSAVQRIKREQQDLSVVGPLIQEIKMMLASRVELG